MSKSYFWFFCYGFRGFWLLHWAANQNPQTVGKNHQKGRSTLWFWIIAVCLLLSISSFVSRIIPKTGNCEDIPSGKCKIGISRIWVAQDFRKQKIATNLVLTFERYFAYGAILKKGENYAFSHTTPDGTNFASKYVGLPNGQFLTYNPCK